MTDVLQSARKGPETASSAIVFLHGYGADGADLLGLADPLAPLFPNTSFFAPDAPDPCKMNPAGRQWFPIPWIDGSSEAEVGVALAASAAKLNAFLDKLLDEEGLSADRLALVGFSQGTMLSLHVAPRRADPIAAVAGFSGRLLLPGALDEAVSKPPILLLHGDADEVVTFSSMAEAESPLVKSGFSVETFVMSGVGHGISPDGLQRAAGFLHGHLSA